jgi:hypothetical protein
VRSTLPKLVRGSSGSKGVVEGLRGDVVNLSIFKFEIERTGPACCARDLTRDLRGQEL